jgi:Na+/H+ antiporter NhaD/arsenite permease-like protein
MQGTNNMGSALTAWDSLYFVVLILSMAFIPLFAGRWWRKWYPLVTTAVALPCLISVGLKLPAALWVAMEEYVAFIALIGALYIISGGIDLETPARGRPASNVLFLLTGAVLANFLGTTGASVVLIRPLLRANAWRRHIAHLYVFFIILVSNLGGMLTPLGDPPLFLGYLHGVPFLWTLTLFPIWGTSVSVLLGVFWLIDCCQVRKEPLLPQARGDAAECSPHFGLHGARNVVLLVVVIVSLFLPAAIRIAIMVLAALLSVRATPEWIRKRNDFTYHPIIEVAILFAGIFITIVPVQELVRSAGGAGFVSSPAACFWSAGMMSSVLDNAPAYLIFFEAAKESAAATATLVAGVPAPLLTAIAIGCVMMGANTYIGNGPNFMVKAICEDEGIRMPSFLGYTGWTLLLLLPLYGLITWVFLL